VRGTGQQRYKQFWTKAIIDRPFNGLDSAQRSDLCNLANLRGSGVHDFGPAFQTVPRLELERVRESLDVIVGRFGPTLVKDFNADSVPDKKRPRRNGMIAELQAIMTSGIEVNAFQELQTQEDVAKCLLQ
jgi:hypothetical protein